MHKFLPDPSKIGFERLIPKHLGRLKQAGTAGWHVHNVHVAFLDCVRPVIVDGRLPDSTSAAAPHRPFFGIGPHVLPIPKVECTLSFISEIPRKVVPEYGCS